ncbi:hypothetical protein B0H14DRAFT_3461091 [Mycena olivaceomarginata]|nr:hypothetical protein B0H14DRAFT_3461091 [Mycena olivaceomarginata]
MDCVVGQPDEHYSLILDPSTIESSESGDESDSEDDSPSQMEVDEPSPSPNHHQTFDFDFADIPDLLGLDQDDNAAMDIGDSVSPAQYESEREDEYEGGLDFDDPPDDNEWKEFDEEDDQDIPISREEMITLLGLAVPVSTCFDTWTCTDPVTPTPTPSLPISPSPTPTPSATYAAAAVSTTTERYGVMTSLDADELTQDPSSLPSQRVKAQTEPPDIIFRIRQSNII